MTQKRPRAGDNKLFRLIRQLVQVPSEMWDQLVFELNGKGYPKTTLSYDSFASMNGFTATEFEKKTGLIFDAQDRAQKTLLRQTGIEEPRTGQPEGA